MKRGRAAILLLGLAFNPSIHIFGLLVNPWTETLTAPVQNKISRVHTTQFGDWLRNSSGRDHGDGCLPESEFRCLSPNCLHRLLEILRAAIFMLAIGESV